MIKFLSPGLLLGLLLPATALAQRDVPLRSPQERRVFQEQTAEFQTAIIPVLETAARSTVRVWGRSPERLAYGTVVGDGSTILTKWSEIAEESDDLRITGSEDVLREVKLAGVYEDEDVAVLTIQGEPLTPVQWSFVPPVIGQFLAAPQPDGTLAGFGVVSVLERNLRETDYAYLGVTGVPGFEGPGVKVAEVAEESGAAAAGIRPDDVILKAGEREISGLLELRSALIGVEPGSEIELLVKRDDRDRKVQVLLGNRPELPQFPAARLRQMERMGGEVSEVGTSFSRVLQTDMRLEPNRAGGPVVDLEGQVVGITLARADRTRSFVMPAAVVVDLLEREATDPALAEVPQPDRPPFAMAGMQPNPWGGPQDGPQSEPLPDVNRMRRQLSDVRRLRELLNEELQALEVDEDS